MKPFEIRDPLPEGTTLLEASAGTGKTWTIAALVTRFVAEGVASLDELLIVTFGRAASQELRQRVREQLVEAERALDGEDVTPSDLVDLLLDASPDVQHLRHQRVVAALASFDSATIATTHQFCHMVLESLGVAGDSDGRARLVESVDELTIQVVDDLYLQAYGLPESGPPAFGYREALAIARRVVDDPQAAIVPVDSADPASAIRARFALGVRRELDARKRRLGILSYDDLLTQLADALEQPDSPACARMRQRWSVVMVDEFQDTDPVQWAVLDRAFSGHARMVLIGDPKQAIYAFRGGDVQTYLRASKTAQTHQTLSVNRRSDAPLVDSLAALLGGASLGEDIAVLPVEAFHDTSRLEGAPNGAPVRLRVLQREQFGKSGTANLFVGDVRPYIATDLARDVATLLASGAMWCGRPLQRSDVAVIAATHRDLELVREALAALGIPAVAAGGGSVFATPAAAEWLQLLEALEQPHRADRVRAAALTAFVGMTAVELDAKGDVATDDLSERMRGWADLLTTRGVAAVVEAANAGGMPARVLTELGGERRLTDLRHIGEVLHERMLADHLGTVALVTWLRSQVADGRAGRGEERTRRLDSDAAAVQLVTVHASKGLQYPVVYLPSLSDRWVSEPDIPLFHDADGQRHLDVGSGRGEGRVDHIAAHAREDAAESLRLLYVAVTRAQSQVVMWWAPTRNAERSPLHRLALGRVPRQEEVPDALAVPSDADVLDHFRKWESVGGPHVEPAIWARSTEPPPTGPTPSLAARTFTRVVDTAWRRTSYSALTRGAAETNVASEPEVVPRDDEALGAVVVDEIPDGPRSPMADLPVGATFGSLVHGVLEVADWQASDLRAELLARIDEQLVSWPVELDREVLADAVVAVMTTPLGPLVEGRTLGEVPVADRLAELEFEVPLAGGDSQAGREVLLGDLAPLLRAHLPVGDPVRGYADALDQPALGGQPLRGYLTGSIDVALRLHTDAGPRFFVIDYKTNWLGENLLDYRPEVLDGAMGHSDYPLQALLYAVVLHRYLRWRQPGYEPSKHLGGVLYLYLRGLGGPESPQVGGQPCGVFTWRPPVALVDALSDLLDGAEVSA